jgi:3-methylcrotonyl-CoA carboxylase alpha subunit
VAGLTTNIPFIMSLCDHEQFIAGNVHTDFIPMHREKLFEPYKQALIDDGTVCCALASILNDEASTSKSMLKS